MRKIFFLTILFLLLTTLIFAQDKAQHFIQIQIIPTAPMAYTITEAPPEKILYSGIVKIPEPLFFEFSVEDYQIIDITTEAIDEGLVFNTYSHIFVDTEKGFRCSSKNTLVFGYFAPKK